MRTTLRVMALIFSIGESGVALGGGVCILHPKPFTLRSETVYWSIKIKPGGECIQGLRWSTILINNISIVEAPKSGQLMIQGPAFRYFSNAVAQGSDSFKISISGTSLRMSGMSSIDIDITSE